MYKDSCQQLGVIPASYFLRHIDDASLDMTHHGIGPKNIKPIAIALVVSINLSTMAWNGISREGGIFLKWYRVVPTGKVVNFSDGIEWYQHGWWYTSQVV